MNKHILIYSLICMFLLSCGGMNDPIQEYLDKGEVDYIGKVDSVITAGGNGRILFSWKINADPRIEECVICWNNGADSLIYPIDKSKLVNGRVSTIFDNMKEGTYVFNMYHTGKNGYNSVKQEVVGQVYGDLYKETLTPRKIKKVAAFKEYAEINWSSAEASLKVNLHYVNNIGNKIIKEVLPSEEKTIINDYSPGSKFSYETSFLPDINALDTFFVESDVLKFPSFYELERNDWTATASSDKAGSDGSTAQVLLDGNSTTYWHSMWSPDAPLPHWILIDMKKEYEVNAVEVYKKPTNTDCKKLNILVSMDGENFNQIGTIEYENTPDPTGKDITLNTPVRAKFIKLLITESWRPPYVSLSEVKVLGKSIE